MALKIRGVTVVDFGGNGDSSNIGLGSRALDSNVSGSFNVAVGKDALPCNTTASQNVVVGADAGTTLSTGDNNILIGYNAQVDSAGKSNQIVIGNNSNTSLKIPGLGLNTDSASAGNVLCWTGSGFEFSPAIGGSGGDGIDSAAVINLVDSAYVQLRQDFAYSSLTGAPNVLDSADVATIAGSGAGGLDSGDVTTLIDSAYVQLRQDFAYSSLTGAPNVLDSADVATIAGSISGLDSTGVRNLVESAYVQLRQDFAYSSLVGAPNVLDSADVAAIAGSISGLDSTAVRSLVDSAYISSKLTASDISYDNTTTEFTATNIQSAIDELDTRKLDVSDLAANVRLFATSDSSDIATYFQLVTTTSDSSYDDSAVLIPTGAITGSNQFIAALASDTGIIQGNTGSLTITTLGNIRRTETSSTADFYYEVYKRDSAGAETLLTTSSNTSIVNNDTFEQFYAAALLPDTPFALGDRVVLKYYGNKIEGGGDPEFEFQFGGASPVYTNLPVPVDVVPHTNTAEDILVTTSSFDGILSGADDTVQKAFDTIDDLSTTNIPEGTQLYYTDGRVNAAVEALVDSNYIAQRTPIGDSASVVSLIDSAYIELRRPAEAIFGPITGNGADYAFVGDGFPTSANDPDLYLQRGLTYIFRMDASGHPFFIRESAGGTNYNDGVVNNGAETGDIVFTVPMNAPSTLVYQCSVHGGMVGNIYISDPSTFADSASIIAIVDSAYVQLRQDFAYSSLTGAPNVLDSADVAAIAGGGGGGTDSATVVTLINDTVDSAYIQALFPSTSFAEVDIIYDSFTADGISTNYSIGEQAELNDILVTVSGVIQRPGVDYSFTDSVLSFTSAPDSDLPIGIRKLESRIPENTIKSIIDSNYVNSLVSATVKDVDIVYDSFFANGLTTDFAIGEAAELNDLIVTINGIIQRPSIDYTFSDSILSFTSAPDSNSTVGIRKLNADISGGGGADSATVVTIINDTVDSAYVQSLSGSSGGTLGSLTKSFIIGETSSITLSESISPAPVVSVTKEVGQTGVSSKGTWDVASDGSNYDLHDTAYAVTLTPSSASSDGTFTLGSGSFASTDVGKRIVGNGGEAVLTATDGSYSIVTPFDDANAIASGDWSMFALTFDGTDGVKLAQFIKGYDLSVASYDSVSFSVGSQEDLSREVTFNNDGSKMYIVGTTNDSVYQYSLSTPFDISTASYDSVSFSVSSEESVPTHVAFNDDGSKMFVLGLSSTDVNQYTLSTAFDISTASFDSVTFSVLSQGNTPTGMAFNNNGTKMYIVGSNSDSVKQYSVGSIFTPTSAYYPAITKLSGQIDTAFWTDINTMTADETLNGGEVYYAVSTDDRTTWSVIHDTDGVRPIVRNNAGTWQYNDATAYTGETWVNATTNDELYALQESLEAQQFNRMNSTQLDAVTDSNHYTLGDTLDLAIMLYTDSAGSIPESDGVSINYDAAALNRGAILGTDYDYDFPNSTTVRITSNATQNLKVRVV